MKKHHQGLGPINKIAVFNGGKGRQGKTPLAVELAKRLDFALATNEERKRDDIKSMLPKGQFLQIEPDEVFPNLPVDFSVVFDLAGSIRGFENSILSALEKAQIILVPVVNEDDSISGTAQTIVEMQETNITATIVVIANMLRSHTRQDYSLGQDFQDIKTKLFSKLDHSFPILPLKYSEGFKQGFREKKSIQELVEDGGLNRHHYSLLSMQLNDIIHFLSQINR